MYCPICGQQQATDSMRFCSRCGFSLIGVATVIANNGSIPAVQPTSRGKLVSPRKRGLLQGLFVLLIGTLLVVPLVAILSAALNFDPVLVALLAVLSFCGGLLRMLYALFFEEGGAATVPNNLLPHAANNLISSFKSSAQQNSLPPQSVNSAATNAAYVRPALQNTSHSNWHDEDTGKLSMPPSVTEDTTKLLDKDT